MTKRSRFNPEEMEFWFNEVDKRRRLVLSAVKLLKDKKLNDPKLAAIARRSIRDYIAFRIMETKFLGMIIDESMAPSRRRAPAQHPQK